MLTYPNIDPVIISFGPLAIRWYGVVYLLGFLYVHYWLRKEWRWLGMRNKEEVDSILGILVLGMILGARFTYVLFYNFDSYIQGPWWEIFAVWHGGLSFHGGFFGAFFATLYVSRKYSISLPRLWDVLLVPTPLVLGLGRIANFINGELWGRETTVSWGMVFPGGGPNPRHPSQFYEAFLEGFLLFLLMQFLWRRHLRPGTIGASFCISYGILRSIGELFREPDKQLGFVIGGWTMGQLMSVALFSLGVGAFCWIHSRKPIELENNEYNQRSDALRSKKATTKKKAKPKKRKKQKKN